MQTNREQLLRGDLTAPMHPDDVQIVDMYYRQGVEISEGFLAEYCCALAQSDVAGGGPDSSGAGRCGWRPGYDFLRVRSQEYAPADSSSTDRIDLNARAEQERAAEQITGYAMADELRISDGWAQCCLPQLPAMLRTPLWQRPEWMQKMAEKEVARVNGVNSTTSHQLQAEQLQRQLTARGICGVTVTDAATMEYSHCDFAERGNFTFWKDPLR
eukprot:g20596.t1